MIKKLLLTTMLMMIISGISISLMPQPLIAGGDKAETELTKKVSTVGLGQFNKFWVEMYNDNRPAYALCATGAMLCLGVAVGFGTELILRLVGFKTTKIIHNE